MTFQRNLLNYAAGALTTAIVFTVFRPTAELVAASPPANTDADQLPAQIAAERFVVRDKRGRTLATFGASDKLGEGAALKFFDNFGKERLTLLTIPANSYEPMILLRDSHEKTRISISVSPEDNPEIDLYGDSETSEMAFRTSAFMGPAILLSERNKCRALLVGREKIAKLNLRPTTQPTTRPKDSDNGTLILFNEAGDPIWQLPSPK